MDYQKTFALIPAYNPGNVIKQVVKQTQKYIKNIIIVNDGCDAENTEIIKSLQQADVNILTHTENLGKGYALHTGIEYAIKQDADVLVMLDSDGQHNPQELPKFIEFSQLHDFQLVVGVRTEIEKMPFRSKIGNIAMAKIFNLLYGQKLHDTQSGYRMMSKEFAQFFLKNIDSGRYETEMKMLMVAAKNNIKINQIPIQTQYIDGNSNSKFRPVIDSLRVLGSFAKYSGVGFLSFLIDYGLFLTFTYVFGLYFLTAHIFARICSSSFNFIANKRFVFQHKHSVIRALLKYMIAVAISISISSALLLLFVKLFAVKVPLAKIMAEALTFLTNYFVLKHFVFKSK